MNFPSEEIDTVLALVIVAGTVTSSTRIIASVASFAFANGMSLDTSRERESVSVPIVRMSAIRNPRRHNEWWVDFRFRGRRIRRRSPVQTKRGAEAFEQQLLAELWAGASAHVAPSTVAKSLEKLSYRDAIERAVGHQNGHQALDRVDKSDAIANAAA